MLAAEVAEPGAGPAPEPRRTFTEQARRAQILRAAIDTVNDVGYPRASLSAIAARAGVAKSAIGYYFDGKDALLLEVLGQVFGTLDDLLEAADDPGAPAAARLGTYIDTYLGFADTHRAGIVAAIEIAVSHRGADGVPLCLSWSEEDSTLLRSILNEAMASGDVRAMPLVIAVGIVEAVLDVVTTQLQRDLSADLTEVTSQIRRALPAALAP